MGRWLVVLFFLGSCFSTAQYDAANAQRISLINQQYNEEQRNLDAKYLELVESANELKKYMIQIQPGSSYAPVNRIDQHSDVTACHATCRQEAVSLPDESINDFIKTCAEKICVNVYSDALAAAYYSADFSWVASQLRENDDADLEALLAYSHNQKILADIQQLNDGAREFRDDASRNLEAARQEEIQSSWQQRSYEVSVGQAQHRAKWLAVSQALSQMGNRTGASSTVTGSSTYSTVSSTSCTSDFSCGVGSRCVKERYASSGTCMKEVNQYGNPTYAMPRSSSIGPNLSVGCKLLTDCPIGFTCDAKTGACLR